MLLAIRNLTRDRTRFGLSVAGVALAVMLILLLGAYRSGIYRQTSAYLDQTPGSVVVAQHGVTDFLASNSILPNGVAAAVEQVPGVARVIPVVARAVILEMDGSKQLAFFVGYQPGVGGGPWSLAEGREPTGSDEVVLDRVMAAQDGIKLGDQVEMLDRSLTVVGLSNDTALWVGSFVFADASSIQSLMQSPEAYSFLFVTPAAGVTPEQLRDRLQVPGTDALLKSDVIAADQHLFAKVYDAAIGLMALIAFLVGVLVVGLVVYTATIERRREYGAFKAIGARNRTLYKVVAMQALIAGVAGAVVGTGLAYGVGWLLVSWRPQFPVVIEPSAILVALASSAAMAVLAALVPARAIGLLAPAEVFR